MGVATAGTALAVVLGGSTPAYAGWSATPTTAAAPSSSADASCQSQLSEAPRGPAGTSLGSGAWQSVLTDVRGPFTVALFQNDGAYAACFTSPSFTEINELSSSPANGGVQSGELSVHSGSAAGAGSAGSGPAAGQSAVVLEGTSSGDLNQVVENHLTTTSEGPYTLIDGRVASGVTGVTLVRDDGQDVVATVADGWFVAWWPGADSPATSGQVVKATGTTTEPFVPSAKLGAPGSCTSTAGTADCAGSNTGAEIQSGNSGSSGNTGNSGNIAWPGQNASNSGGTGTGPSTKSVP